MLALALLAFALTNLAAGYPDTSGITSGIVSNTTLPAVCTPDQCLQGDNSLTAGTLVIGSVNGTSQRVTLLLGDYTSASLAASNASSSVSSVFSKSSAVNATTGFLSSGSLTSSLTVSLQAGLTAYSSPLYEGVPIYVSLPSTASNVTDPLATSAESVLLTSTTWAIVQLANDESSRLVLWDSIADVGELDGGAGSGGINVIDVQARGCPTACSSGGVCTGNGTCACLAGFSGSTCGECSAGFYGKTCEACAAGCAACDDGITGTGLCLDAPSYNVTLPSFCDCANGICASNSTSATCECSAGWTAATNGTQCAACATGYYMAAGGDCLACDPSCASCSSPSGTCLACQDGLQPLSSDGTKCTTATTATTNGTFITCADRTFWDTTSSSCVDCNPLCETCFKQGTDGCLSCRTPNVLMPGGSCVAMDSASGVCDGSGQNGTQTASGWVFDNAKSVCDAFSPSCEMYSGRDRQFQFGVDEIKLEVLELLAGELPGRRRMRRRLPGRHPRFQRRVELRSLRLIVRNVFDRGLLLHLVRFVLGPHPQRDLHFELVLSSGVLLILDKFLDLSRLSSRLRHLFRERNLLPDVPVHTARSDLVQVVRTDLLLERVLRYGQVELRDVLSVLRDVLGCDFHVPSDGCTVIDRFGVCLEDLVTVAATSSASTKTSETKLPWWAILLIVLALLAVVGFGAWLFRRKEQERRRAHTARFAKDLGDKEVDKKLAALPISIAYPPVPRATSPTSSHVIAFPPMSPSGRDATYDIPLTPARATTSHFVLEDPASPVSSYAPSSPRPSRPPAAGPRDEFRWSVSSYGSKVPPAPRRVEAQPTGGSVYSQRTLVTQAGNTLTIQSRNPFLGRM